jgi:hypothetical protein
LSLALRLLVTAREGWRRETIDIQRASRVVPVETLVV